jgi:hypothetical protein
LILQERSSQSKLRDRGSDREYTCVAYTYIVFSGRHLNHEQPQTVARDVRILQITVADQPNQRLGGSTFLSVSVLIIEVERRTGTAGTRTRLRTFLLRIQCSPTSKLCSCADPASHYQTKYNTYRYQIYSYTWPAPAETLSRLVRTGI